MPKYKLTVEYDGTNYSGWQTQANAKSIQGTLISAAEKLFQTRVDIHGSERTDAGVHALAQVVHLAAAKEMPLKRIMEGLNDLLPANINIISVEEAAPDFHARHDAIARSYIYVISKRRTAFGKKYVWWVKDRLDVKKMRECMALFEGFHDFVSFADKRRDKGASTLVEIQSLELHAFSDMLVIRIVGSHFLWKMVRRLVGVMVEVGRGKLALSDVKKMMERHSDVPASLTAPPSGLFLEQVLYEGDVLKLLKLPLPDLLAKRG